MGLRGSFKLRMRKGHARIRKVRDVVLVRTEIKSARKSFSHSRRNT